MIPENNSDKEITLFFNGKDFEERLVHAELKRIHEFGYKLKGIDVSETKLTVEQAEKITRELGTGNPRKVLSNEFLTSYLVSHVDNFNEFNTTGQLLEDPTALKTPIVIRDGIMDFLDTSQDYIYDELKEEYDLREAAKQKAEEGEAKKVHVANGVAFQPKQFALYFSVLILVLTILYQVIHFKAVDQMKFDQPVGSAEEVVNFAAAGI